MFNLSLILQMWSHFTSKVPPAWKCASIFHLWSYIFTNLCHLVKANCFNISVSCSRLCFWNQARYNLIRIIFHDANMIYIINLLINDEAENSPSQMNVQAEEFDIKYSNLCIKTSRITCLALNKRNAVLNHKKDNFYYLTAWNWFKLIHL